MSSKETDITFILFFREKKSIAHRRVSECHSISKTISRWSDFFERWTDFHDDAFNKCRQVYMCRFMYRERVILWHLHRLLAVPYLLLVAPTVCDVVFLSIREWEQIEKAGKRERERETKGLKGKSMGICYPRYCFTRSVEGGSFHYGNKLNINCKIYVNGK